MVPDETLPRQRPAYVQPVRREYDEERIAKGIHATFATETGARDQDAEMCVCLEGAPVSLELAAAPSRDEGFARIVATG